jgi:hypothetical protein
MTPFKLYISFDREVRNRLEDVVVNTAEITYWLNKALEEFVDKKYVDYEVAEDVIQDLKGLYTYGVVTTLTSTTETPNSYTGILGASVRYMLNERCLISYSGTSINVKVTPVTQDTINIKLKDPYSPHLYHQGNAEPLRLFASNKVYLTTDGSYTITQYSYKYLKDPTQFKIQDALKTTTLTEFPHKAYKEVLAIAIRMFLENNSNARYNTYNLEEKKTEL